MDILVGFDGSPESHAALAWAMIEARVRGCGVSVVNTCASHELPHIDDALALAARFDPAIAVHGSVLLGSPAQVLEWLSPGVALLVIGRSDHGVLPGLRLGPVIRHVLANAGCPVITVPPGEVAAPERVVAAIRTQSANEQTLRFAFAEASHHGVAVHGVRVLRRDQPPDAFLARALASSLIRWQFAYPTTAVTSAVPIGAVAEVLAATCTSHDLLVLGHHRHGLAPRALGGCVVETLHLVSCPVAVVHEPIQAYAGASSRERRPARQLRPAPAGSFSVAVTNGPPPR